MCNGLSEGGHMQYKLVVVTYLLCVTEYCTSDQSNQNGSVGGTPLAAAAQQFGMHDFHTVIFYLGIQYDCQSN